MQNHSEISKTAKEIKILRKAVSISVMGQIEVMKAMKPGMSESEIQGIHEFVFKKYGVPHVLSIAVKILCFFAMETIFPKS